MDRIKISSEGGKTDMYLKEVREKDNYTNDLTICSM